MYKPKVYTASKIHHHLLWKKMKEDIDWDFVEWTATWVEHPMIGNEAAGDPIDDAVFVDAWSQNIWDVRRSDFVLLYAGGSNALKGALIEAGCALGIGLQVLAVGLTSEHSWAFHPAVKCFPNLVGARQHLYKFTTMVPPNRRTKGRPPLGAEDE
jgi:hypothetical protein